MRDSEPLRRRNGGEVATDSRRRAETRRFNDRRRFDQGGFWKFDGSIPAESVRSYPGSWWPLIEEAFRSRCW